MEEIHKILDERVFSHLNSPAGEGLSRKLREVLGGITLDHQALIYFDFWNNTLELLLARHHFSPL